MQDLPHVCMQHHHANAKDQWHTFSETLDDAKDLESKSFCAASATSAEI
jgi:hypothetical protein